MPFRDQNSGKLGSIWFPLTDAGSIFLNSLMILRMPLKGPPGVFNNKPNCSGKRRKVFVPGWEQSRAERGSGHPPARPVPHVPSEWFWLWFSPLQHHPWNRSWPGVAAHAVTSCPLLGERDQTSPKENPAWGKGGHRAGGMALGGRRAGLDVMLGGNSSL